MLFIRQFLCRKVSLGLLKPFIHWDESCADLTHLPRQWFTFNFMLADESVQFRIGKRGLLVIGFLDGEQDRLAPGTNLGAVVSLPRVTGCP
ncbi:MAG: hypothetical protein BIFFINMI_03757 [Phycisphaerae bacterium]|nr:hypothetical protein [Phycisphaerae bacterium]